MSESPERRSPRLAAQKDPLFGEGSPKKRPIAAPSGEKKAKTEEPPPPQVIVIRNGEQVSHETYETFDQADLPARITKKLKKNFSAPTPIQAAAWPLLMKGLDVIGIAKTGSGKTLAFSVPFLAMSETGTLTRYEQGNTPRPRMVVMAPTRELTQQIAKVISEFGQLSKTKDKYPVVTLVGGLPKWEQKEAMRKGLDIACCTPGRLEDFLSEETLCLDSVQLCCLDEADRMLDMGFVDVVKSIIGRMPKDHQTCLFSATWPESVQHFVSGLTRAKKLATVTVGIVNERPTANAAINQIVEVIEDKHSKFRRLQQILKESKARKTLVFALYKKEAAWVTTSLQKEGYDVTSLHGDMAQTARSAAIDRFKENKIPMLCATDVAGRGLDVEDVELVVNFTFPLTIEDYVHRIGRTGRAGKSGKAITFFCPNDIEKALADDLAGVLKEAKQVVPAGLQKIADSAGGSKATKKKAHSLYGAHFKSAAEMAKLEAKKIHTTFDDSD